MNIDTVDCSPQGNQTAHRGACASTSRNTPICTGTTGVYSTKSHGFDLSAAAE
jgi:hypothetical protein